MDKKHLPISDLRKATPQEHQLILTLWREFFEAESKSYARFGSVTIPIGCVLLAMCGLFIFEPDMSQLGNIAIVAFIAILLLYIGYGMKKHAKEYKRRVRNLDSRAYLVAPATAVRYQVSSGANRRYACCRVDLSDGSRFPVLCHAPISSALDLQSKGINLGSILIIQMKNDSFYFVIPW